MTTRLVSLLRHHARGSYASEAATGLLIDHGTWLRRRDFLAACVWLVHPDGQTIGPAATGVSERPLWADDLDPYDEVLGSVDIDTAKAVGISWGDVARFLDTAPCSGSEARILRLAAGLAGAPPEGPLGDLLSGLDGRNSALVLDAVGHVLRCPRHRAPAHNDRPF
jgi:hypothetical protein